MKFGIIGSGMIARFHAEAIQAMSGSSLVAITGRTMAKSEELAEEFGCKAYASMDEFLNDSQIEVVTIATISGVHLESCVAAARAGKHDSK